MSHTIYPISCCSGNDTLCYLDLNNLLPDTSSVTVLLCMCINTHAGTSVTTPVITSVTAKAHITLHMTFCSWLALMPYLFDALQDKLRCFVQDDHTIVNRNDIAIVQLTKWYILHAIAALLYS